MWPGRSGVFESARKRSEGVPAGLSKVNDDNFVYACVSKSFGSSLQPGRLGTNDPYQFIKNRQLVLPATIDLQLASVLLSLGKAASINGGCFDEH